MKNELNLAEKIIQLKREKNAVILAHYYQNDAIQNIADFVGDSYGLSIEASKTSADIIVFAGVHFMGETAKILNPSKKVLLPDINASCSLAESCPPVNFKAFLDQHPDHIVVTYINCSAEIKTMSDYVCTSSNAVQIINSIPKDKKIIFAPDKNLGKYLIKITGRDLLLWDGSCVVHEAFSFDKLLDLYRNFPKAKIIAHPESEYHILEIAHFIGSTSEMIEYLKKSDGQTFIIATEAGILCQMNKEMPGKLLIPAPSYENNSCACSECAFMKLNTLEKLANCLEFETPEIVISNEIIRKAIIPIQKMISIVG